MFLIHALKASLESIWHAAQICIAALVLLAVVVFKLTWLDDEEGRDDC